MSIKNDEHLVKLAAVIQRHLTKNSSGDAGSEFMLSDSEKEELMDTLHNTVNELQIESDRIDNIKDKSNKINKGN